MLRIRNHNPIRQLIRSSWAKQESREREAWECTWQHAIVTVLGQLLPRVDHVRSTVTLQIQTLTHLSIITIPLFFLHSKLGAAL
jgi:hypothetical protein